MIIELNTTNSVHIEFPDNTKYNTYKWDNYSIVTIRTKDTKEVIKRLYVKCALKCNHLWNYIYNYLDFRPINFFENFDVDIDVAEGHEDIFISLQKLTYIMSNMKVVTNTEYTLDVNGIKIPLKEEEVKAIKESLAKE